MNNRTRQIRVSLLALVLMLGCNIGKADAASYVLVDNKPVALSSRFAGGADLKTVAPESSTTSRHVIVISRKGNGLVSSEGAINVEHGAVKSFTFLPDNGYQVSALRVDGELVESVDSYTFINVSADHAVEVFFAEENDQRIALVEQ